MSTPPKFDPASEARLIKAILHGVTESDLRSRFGFGVMSAVARLRKEGKLRPPPKRELPPDGFDDLFGPAPNENDDR